ncbi:PAS domain-containing protein [Chitinophaga nivalis]|uniref:histidine kinase n=1 Tax=Chitinophaga nivalis TaxID=2991709 RepID=A0ABT3IUZ0_9BACT|nr:PAS domain-containing protein [Chitinophaga nivalis]MCW3462800.1 PAS domain-containing protein [Chitinophaga nivalis]MCW3487510.1 PAS domain-containing protein [Chitinophaga nivalis]
MQRAPIKIACLCLLFVAIVFNGLFIIHSAASGNWLLPVINQLVLVAVFLLLLWLLLRHHQQAIHTEKIFNDHPVPMWIYDKETLRFLSVNQAAVDKYGYTKNEFRQLTLKDIRESAEVPYLMENITERCNGKAYRGIWKHRKKDKTDFFVEIYAHSTTYYGKKARFIMARDVDAQIRTSREARELGMRYELLSQVIDDAIYDKNFLTGQVTWNHGLSSLFAHVADAGTDAVQWWEDNLHPSDRARVCCSLHECISNNGQYWSEEYRFLCAGGNYKYVTDRAFIIYENEGTHPQPLRMIGIMQDIDKHVNQARQLEDQHQRLREIAWINSHEIRRPVVSILSIAGLFDKSNQDIHLNARLMEWLHESTQQLDEIIHKIEHTVKDIR